MGRSSARCGAPIRALSRRRRHRGRQTGCVTSRRHRRELGEQVAPATLVIGRRTVLRREALDVLPDLAQLPRRVEHFQHVGLQRLPAPTRRCRHGRARSPANRRAWCAGHAHAGPGRQTPSRGGAAHARSAAHWPCAAHCASPPSRARRGRARAGQLVENRQIRNRTSARACASVSRASSPYGTESHGPARLTSVACREARVAQAAIPLGRQVEPWSAAGRRARQPPHVARRR